QGSTLEQMRMRQHLLETAHDARGHASLHKLCLPFRGGARRQFGFDGLYQRVGVFGLRPLACKTRIREQLARVNDLTQALEPLAMQRRNKQASVLRAISHHSRSPPKRRTLSVAQK